MSIIKELIKRGIIDRQKGTQIELEAREREKSIEEILIERNLIDEEKLFQIKSQILNIPFKTVEPKEVPPEVLDIIPEETAKFYKMIPLAKRGNILEVGMVWPEDIEAKEALKFLARKANLETKIFLISLSNFKKISQRYRMTPKEIEKMIEKAEKEMKTAVPPLIGIERIVEEAPVVKAVENILRYGVEGKA